ncbi:hypothetical protein DFH27DRAFT_536331 [Peziza echinospora]|nr:hypothetical protein DFH27DRAFT_536331 [Peziza echinospora]
MCECVAASEGFMSLFSFFLFLYFFLLSVLRIWSCGNFFFCLIRGRFLVHQSGFIFFLTSLLLLVLL